MEKGIGDHDCQMIVWKKWRVAHVGKGFEMSGSNCLVPRDIWKAQKWPLWATAVALIPNSVYHYLPLIHRLNYIGVITKFVDLCQVSQVIPWYAVAKWKKGVGDHDCRMILWKNEEWHTLGRVWKWAVAVIIVWFHETFWKAQKWPFRPTAVALIPHYNLLLHWLNYFCQ